MVYISIQLLSTDFYIAKKVVFQLKGLLWTLNMK